jgi:hypothetical protein
MTEQPQKAYWNHHEYKRHSVDRDVKKFIGLKTMQKIIETSDRKIVRAFLAFLFSTGLRVSECLSLRRANFQIVDAQPPLLIVSGVKLEKRYEKVEEYYICDQCQTPQPKSKECVKCHADLVAHGQRHYLTRPTEEEIHEFPITLDEPFSQILLEWLKKNDDYLFLSPYTGKPYTRVWAYSQVRTIGAQLGLELWPHRFRSERASQLGKKLKAESLMERFSWENWATAKKYSKKGALGLAQELGVKVTQTTEEET